MSYLVLDLETTVKNEGDFAIGDFAASPFCEDNYIVCWGSVGNGMPYRGVYNTSLYSILRPPKSADTLLIGQNIKFDLLYLMREPEWRAWLGTGRIWDTMLAEYILSGQTVKYASLDYLSNRYGGTSKPDIIKQYWEAGVPTEDIPKEELLEYMKGDVINTQLVAMHQILLAKKRGLLNLMFMEMDSLLATTEMEFNGIAFDKYTAERERHNLAVKSAALFINLRKMMHEYLEYMQEGDVNPGSSQQLSIVLFGGTYKYTAYEEVIDEVTGEPYRYKSGKKKGEIKYKKIEREASTDGLGLPPPPGSETSKYGIYSTSEDVLNEFDFLGLVRDVLRYRGIHKDMKTYYEGYSALVWPDKCIHGKIDHVGTNTGRFNSSKPNLQNLSGKDK